MACALFLGFLTGVGIFQHMFWIPEMLASPAALEKNLSSEGGEPQKFWIPLHGLTFLTMIGALVFNWRNPVRKKLILTAFIAYLYISLISIYFAQQLFAFQEISVLTTFAEKTSQWLALSWHRPLLMAVMEVLLLLAISRSHGNQQTARFQMN